MRTASHSRASLLGNLSCMGYGIEVLGRRRSASAEEVRAHSPASPKRPGHQLLIGTYIVHNPHLPNRGQSLTHPYSNRSCKTTPSPYFAITSTYLPPFFFPFTVPPFRGPASKSSILLAVLNELAGRIGGTAAPPIEGGRIIPAPSPFVPASEAGVPTRLGGPEGGKPGPDPLVGGRAPGGAPVPLPALLGGPLGGPIGGPIDPAPLATRLGGPPRGGGGVAATGAAASAPPFLLTHFFRSSS